MSTFSIKVVPVYISCLTLGQKQQKSYYYFWFFVLLFLYHWPRNQTLYLRSKNRQKMGFITAWAIFDPFTKMSKCSTSYKINHGNMKEYYFISLRIYFIKKPEQVCQSLVMSPRIKSIRRRAKGEFSFEATLWYKLPVVFISKATGLPRV